MTCIAARRSQRDHLPRRHDQFRQRWLFLAPLVSNRVGSRERCRLSRPRVHRGQAAGVYRIAVVGDSFTYGNGVRQQDRYSDLLQAELPAHVEVLNFGTPARTRRSTWRPWANCCHAVHPDFVLLQWYVNDVEDDDSAGAAAYPCR